MTRERFFSITARLLLLAAPFAVGAIILSDSALPWTRLLTLLATEETMRADAGFAFVVRALQIAFFFMARLAYFISGLLVIRWSGIPQANKDALKWGLRVYALMFVGWIL